MYVRITVYSCCTQHRTVLIIFPRNLQTNIIAQMLSICWKWGMHDEYTNAHFPTVINDYYVVTIGLQT